MKNLLKPSCILLYLLTFLNFFLVGVSFSKVTGAAQGQGLAAGTIVLGYGLTFAFTAFVISVLIVKYMNEKLVFKINLLSGLVLIIFISYYALNFFNNKQNTDNRGIYFPPAKVTMVSNKNYNKPGKIKSSDQPMGLGFFKPDFVNRKVLYFYNVPENDKPISEHIPIDSIGFGTANAGALVISYAPPWLKPEHLIPDYEIFYFKILSLSKDFAQVSVNDIMDKSSFIARDAGNVILWPDFLLIVNSVEFINNKEQIIRIKPLSYAGEIKTSFEILKPVLVMEEWMQVEMFDGNYNTLGKGWIQWRNGNELLITYSLLS